MGRIKDGPAICILVAARKTRYLTWATALEVLGIVSVLYLVSSKLEAAGVLAATIAYVIGRISANLFLARPILKLFSPA